MTDAPSTPPVLAALGHAWNAIRANHPEVPAAALTLASRGASLVKAGHYAHDRWCMAEGALPEVFVAAEELVQGAHEVFHTLLHEAVHGLADVRGIQDTSRQGRYHNHRFAELAGELGLRTVPTSMWGYRSELDEHTLDPYTAELTVLAGTLLLWYRARAPRERAVTVTMLLRECPCGRKLRGSALAWSGGSVICGTCHQPFVAPKEH